MTEQDVIRSLAALAQASRLQIFRQLVVAGASGMTPTRLSEALNLPPSALSFHLKELTLAQLITQERDGRHLIYRAAFGAMNDLLAYLTENCCAGDVCAVSDAVAECKAC